MGATAFGGFLRLFVPTRLNPMADVDHLRSTLLELLGSFAMSMRCGQPGQGGSHSPPPGVQALGDMRMDQQCSVPTPPAVSSAMFRCQVPLTSLPNLPR